jgi:cell division protein FtsQ
MLQATRRSFETATTVITPAWRDMGLRALANLLVVVGAVGMLVGMVMMTREWSHRTAIASVQIEGEMQQVNRSDVVARVAAVTHGGYFTANIAAVRAAALQSPWVDNAVVSRQWPDGLHVQITEKQPVARWGDQGLISSRGELFQPPVAVGVQTLPILFGPAGKARYVMEQYRTMNSILRALGLHIVELQLTDRMSWFLRLDNGIQLVVDQDDTVDKLQRFAYLYERQLAPDIARIATIDLRYRNGVAVGWKMEKNLKNINSGV